MSIILHHKPVDPSRTYKVHAWDDSSAWDLPGIRKGSLIDFNLPGVTDARKLKFKFRSTNPVTGDEEWESDEFVRQIRVAAPSEIWSFESAARILYKDPNPASTTYAPGTTLIFKVITENRFSGGTIYVWNPYDPAKPFQEFPESSRASPVSTFNVPLTSWMTGGFHFKLRKGNSWEPDSSNRVWTPGDASLLWVKSGQVSVRHTSLSLTSVPLEVLFPTALGSPPAVELIDPVEDIHLLLTATVTPLAPLFSVARYTASMYPEAVYKVRVAPNSGEGPNPFERSFPADPGNPSVMSRFVLGADGWFKTFPAVAASTTLVIEPRPASAFTGGLTIDVGVGSADKHDTKTATLAGTGMWQATLTVVQDVPHWVRLHSTAGTERKPYDWIDTRRFFTPPAAPTIFFTAEGVYGMTTHGSVPFAEPPSRAILMKAAFGNNVVDAGIFDPREMPHGATQVGPNIYFVLHAPHAASASLVLVDEVALGGPTRRAIPMSLTGDAIYWWCQLPATTAPPGTRYRFVLNDIQEIMDPASREVLDNGNFETALGDDPKDNNTSWSRVLDVNAVSTTAHVAPWQTMGWEALLLYEIHPKRFTDILPGSLTPLELIADELQPVNRQGRPGYLYNLPITALELMPVHEFKSTNSWGYNPAFFFAVDSSYGGSASFARLVRAAHASGRAVLLDLVYNHMNDSPLTKVARDVYRNGEAWGDRINSGHPMVKEFLRQAIVYQWRTFGLDGFRFDDTKTIIGNIGGWEFLDTVRGAVRTAAQAEGRNWPYFVAENDPKAWDVTDTRWSVMDGQWAIDEVYSLGHAAYDSWQQNDDHANELKWRMEAPDTPAGRPYFEAVRFAESHDTVSAQDPGNKRIAARPPFRQGFQMAKAIGTIPLLSKGVPLLFMGEEVGETRAFSFDNFGIVTNPQQHDLPSGTASDNTRVLAWFRALMGLRNDASKGLQGNDTFQVVRTGRRTVAFTCGGWQRLFVVVTFGTEDQRQDSSWLGLPGGAAFKEIFNSSWPAFQVEFEQEQSNGGYDAQIYSGQILNLPFIGAIVLERR